jgi:hypothetical protein
MEPLVAAICNACDEQLTCPLAYLGNGCLPTEKP